MACQGLSQRGFCGQVLTSSLRGNKVPGGPRLSDHVTLLAPLQGHPVPLGVMALLRKWLCHIWDRKKAISSLEVITHSVNAAFSGTAQTVEKDETWGRVTRSRCCHSKPGPPWREKIGKGLPCRSSMWRMFAQPWNDDRWRSIHMTPKPRCRGLSTLPCRQGRAGTSSSSQHPCISEAHWATEWYLRAVKVPPWLARVPRVQWES